MPAKQSEKTFQLSTLMLTAVISAFIMFVGAWIATSKKPNEDRVQELINTKIELEQTRQTPVNKTVEKIQETLEKVLENQEATQDAVEKLQRDVEDIKEDKH